MDDRVLAFVEAGLGNSSFLVDAGAGSAFVVDPRRDVEVYLDAARERSLTIAAIFETHVHADFVSGAAELAALTGARVYFPEVAGSSRSGRSIAGGDTVPVGEVQVTAIHAPGHTPEHLAFHVKALGSDGAVFTGGALMVGGVARTDLISAADTPRLTRAARSSARSLLRELAGGTRVLPTHGAGSFCSVAPGSARETTIEIERANPLYALTEDGFVQEFVSRLGPYPPYFLRLRAVNLAPPAPRPSPAWLSGDEVAKLWTDGVTFVDGRRIATSAVGHIEGSISVAVRPQFAVWLGFLLAWGTPFVVIVEDDARAAEAVRQAAGIGYDQILGLARDDVEGWRSRGIPVTATAVVDPTGVPGRLEEGWQAIDVRELDEIAAGTIAGAVAAPLSSFASGLATADLDPNTPTMVFCAHGERASTAVSLLEGRGFRSLANVRGGFDAWRAAGFPTA